MSSTHSELYYHVIFSTKDRVPLISRRWRDRLHQYMGGIVHTLNGLAKAVGGTDDHAHMLMRLRPIHCLADVIREVKGGSSEWVHNQVFVPDFSWQSGYGAFTVSPSEVPQVADYIAHQEEHHRRCTFLDEYVRLLKEAGVEYDEGYLL